MQAKAYLMPEGQVAIPTATTAPGLYKIVSPRVVSGETLHYHGGDDWQPLLTREQWQAEQSLALRKLGEGEALEVGKWYVGRTDTYWSDPFLMGPNTAYITKHVYYELPPLPPAESEPTTAAKVESLAGEVTLPWTRELTIEEAEAAYDAAPEEPLSEEQISKTVEYVMKHSNREPAPAPAPNLVGERLTEPPEAGTPVVRFMNSEEPSIFQFRAGSIVPRGEAIRYYRWLGPIPVEPKPKPALEYPEQLKLPGIAGIAKCDGGWFAATQTRKWESRNCRTDWFGGGSFEFLPRMLFPYLYSAPYSDVAAKDSWIDNPAYEGGEA